MRDTVRLGRIGGIPIGLNWSLAVVAALLAWVLADNRLPFDAPGYHTGAYATAGAATAVGLVVTVLAHELGHAVVARHQRLTVDGITLSWIGGITRIEGEPVSARREAVLAAAGPAVSLALGGLLWAGHGVIVSSGGPRLLSAAIGWLALINLALGVFNLVPAAPLDGGRILHAVTWGVTGDRWRAGRLAAATGMAFGVVVIVAGAWEAQASRTRPDLIDAVITGLLGWWLIAAARAERQAASLHRALDDTRCADLMRPVQEGPGWVTVDAFLAGIRTPANGVDPVWMLRGWGDGEGYVATVTTAALQRVPPALRSGTRPLDVAVPIDRAAGAHPYDDSLETLARCGGAGVILVTEAGRTVGAILPADVDVLVAAGRRPARAGGMPAARATVE